MVLGVNKHRNEVDNKYIQVVSEYLGYINYKLIIRLTTVHTVGLSALYWQLFGEFQFPEGSFTEIFSCAVHSSTPPCNPRVTLSIGDPGISLFSPYSKYIDLSIVSA